MNAAKRLPILRGRTIGAHAYHCSIDSSDLTKRFGLDFPAALGLRDDQHVFFLDSVGFSHSDNEY